MKHHATALLLCVALLWLAPTATAQTDWYQEFLNSSVLTEETIITQPDGRTFYFAVNGKFGEGIQEDGSFGNGSYVINGVGDVTDCNVAPEACRELLEAASDSPTQPDPPPPPPAEEPPKEEPQAGFAHAYFTQFEVLRDGRVRFDPSGRSTAGAWGFIILPEWYEARRRSSRGR